MRSRCAARSQPPAPLPHTAAALAPLQGYWHWLCGSPSPPYINKWVTFTASIAVALCCGLTYTFAIWCDALKRTYSLSQAQLELIASAANVGGYRCALELPKRMSHRVPRCTEHPLQAGGPPQAPAGTAAPSV